MAHNKYYAICESKCAVETMSKNDIEYRLNPILSNEPILNGILNLWLTEGVSQIAINNEELPKKVCINCDITPSSPYMSTNGVYQTIAFRFNKALGAGGYASAYITLASQVGSKLQLKFLNNPDVSTYTRVFLTAYVDGKTVYVKVDGC